MPDGQILLIDDDEKLTAVLSQYLEKNGWLSTAAHTSEEGVQKIKSTNPRLVILDVMIPTKDGFQTCREIRAFSQVPIIMLTARGEVTDRIVGLEMGADDYLSKPFEPRELLARIQSVLRRTGDRKPKESNRLTFGDLELDLFARTAARRGKNIDLTTAEFDVLALFAKNPGRVMNRNQVMDELKGVDWQAFQRSIDVLISRIRHKLDDDPKRPVFIKTVWGEGYVFVGKVQAAA